MYGIIPAAAFSSQNSRTILKIILFVASLYSVINRNKLFIQHPTHNNKISKIISLV